MTRRRMRSGFVSLVVTLFAALLFVHPMAADETPPVLGGLYPEVKYPRSELLLEPFKLKTYLEQTDPMLDVIVDCRSRKDFDAGHVPFARWVDAADWAKAFGDGRDAEAWTKRIRALGVDPRIATQRVIIYDDAMSKDAARVWWILRYWSVPRVMLVNGGWKGLGEVKIKSVKGSTDLGRKESTFVARADSGRLARRDDVLGSLLESTGKPTILDCRSIGEHEGKLALGNKRAGAMPRAKHLDWVDLIDKKSQRFKTPKELAALFQAAGVELNQPVITHCQSGGRSSVSAFVLELLGAPTPRNYYPGWAEWGSRDDTPIVKPTPEKKPSQ